MYEQDKEAFAKLMMDLCLSVNRPYSAELTRVFWEDLQHVPFPQIERQAKNVRIAGKKTFNSNDLRPPPEEMQAIGGPDNHALLDKLTRAMCRIWDRLSDNQRMLAQFHEFVWSRDKIAPRPVALVIKPDFVELIIDGKKVGRDFPGHRITVYDAEMFDDEKPAAKAIEVSREPGSDDDFDEAAAATALLKATNAQDLLRP